MAGGLFALSDYVTNLVMGRAYQRQLYHHQLAQHQMAIDNAQRSIDQFKQDSTYNRAIMGQSFAARGLSNSTIQTQGIGNFDATAARRSAALNQNLAYQQQGLSLLKTYHKYQQKMLIYNGVRALGETVVSAYSGMSGGGFGDTGQEQQAEQSNDPAAGGGGGSGSGMDAWDGYTGQSDPGFSNSAMGPEGAYSGGGYSSGDGYGGGGSDFGGGSPD